MCVIVCVFNHCGKEGGNINNRHCEYPEEHSFREYLCEFEVLHLVADSFAVLRMSVQDTPMAEVHSPNRSIPASPSMVRATAHPTEEVM